MKPRPRVLLLFLAVSFSMATACTTTPPENSSQRGGNANATQSNASPAKSASQQPNQSTTATIEVSSVPPGAKVLLVSTDAAGAGEPKPKGLTPTTITGLEPGKYTVDLEKPGYKFFQKEVTVKEGDRLKVNATLKKQ